MFRLGCTITPHSEQGACSIQNLCLSGIGHCTFCFLSRWRLIQLIDIQDLISHNIPLRAWFYHIVAFDSFSFCDVHRCDLLWQLKYPRPAACTPAWNWNVLLHLAQYNMHGHTIWNYLIRLYLNPFKMRKNIIAMYVNRMLLNWIFV